MGGGVAAPEMCMNIQRYQKVVERQPREGGRVESVRCSTLTNSARSPSRRRWESYTRLVVLAVVGVVYSGGFQRGERKKGVKSIWGVIGVYRE